MDGERDAEREYLVDLEARAGVPEARAERRRHLCAKCSRCCWRSHRRATGQGRGKANDDCPF